MNHPLHTRQERGAVLLTSLVLITVMAMIGATALAGAALDEELARNHQHATVAFHISESIIERVIDLSDPTNTSVYTMANDLTVGARTGGSGQAAIDYKDDTTLDPTTDTLDVTQAQATVALDSSSLAEGYSSEYYSYQYHIDAQVGLNSSGASVLHRQGAQKIGPAEL